MTTRHPKVRCTVDYWSAAQYHAPGHSDFSGGGFNVSEGRLRQLRRAYRRMREAGIDPWNARDIVLDLLACGAMSGEYVRPSR